MTTIKRTPLNQRQKEVLWAKQAGLCAVCRDPLDEGRFEDDHHLALVDGGTNAIENRRLVHPRCHRQKSIREHKNNRKAKRVKFGRTKRSAPMIGSRKSKWKANMDGTWERR